MSKNLDLKELTNIIETITPYYYVPLFKKKIQKLIKESNKFNDEDKKLIYVVNNMNDMHFKLIKLTLDKIKYPHGFVIVYTKKNGNTFSSERDGKYLVIKSRINKIHVGDIIKNFDGKKVIDIINQLINSYKIPGYNPIRTLGDLQDRSLKLLSYYYPKKVTLIRNNKEIIIELDENIDNEIYFDQVKEQYYKEIKLNGQNTFYFSIKGFKFDNELNKKEYLQILQFIKINLDKYEYIILDLRKSLGGDSKYVFMLLELLYGERIGDYLDNLENFHSVYRVSNILVKWFEHLDNDRVPIIKEELKKGTKYLYVPKVRPKKKIYDKKKFRKEIKFVKTMIVLTDYNCGSACSILLQKLKDIRKEFGVSIIFLGTEDAYDTKFTHPYKINYKNYTLLVPTKYKKYRARDNYETIKPDYYYLDTTYKYKIPIKLIEQLLNKK